MQYPQKTRTSNTVRHSLSNFVSHRSMCIGPHIAHPFPDNLVELSPKNLFGHTRRKRHLPFHSCNPTVLHFTLYSNGKLPFGEHLSIYIRNQLTLEDPSCFWLVQDMPLILVCNITNKS